MTSTSSGALPVAQLADVEVALYAVDARDALPAQEDVARGLHEPLAGDDPLARSWRTRSRADELARAPTRSASLAWRSSGSSLVPAEQQDHPAAGPDAAHADHLAGHVDEAVLLQQHPPVGLQGRP